MPTLGDVVGTRLATEMMWCCVDSAVLHDYLCVLEILQKIQRITSSFPCKKFCPGSQWKVMCIYREFYMLEASNTYTIKASCIVLLHILDTKVPKLPLAEVKLTEMTIKSC